MRIERAGDFGLQAVNPLEEGQERVRGSHCIDAAIVDQAAGDIARKCMRQVVGRPFRKIEAGVNSKVTEI
jgi:hypothetical protein